MDLSSYKIIGLGSGIYFTSHHPRIIEVANRMNPNQKAFIFSTHGSPFLSNYHSTLIEELGKRGVAVLGGFDVKGYDCTGPFILVGGGNKGRPNEKDEQKAIRFVSGILPQYHKDLTIVPTGRHVHVDECCIGCGTCSFVCPMNVFIETEGKAVVRDDDACIHCSLCQHHCPAQAISVKHSFAETIKIAKRHAKKRSLY